jgi:FdhE protein
MTEHPSSNTPARIASELEALIGRDEVAEEYVRFRVRLLGAQVGVYDELNRSAPPSGSEAAEASERKDRPALRRADVLFEDRLLEKLLEGISSALAASGGNTAALDRLSRTAGEDSRFLARLARDTAFSPDEDVLESLAEETGSDVEAILFYGRALAAPFVVHAVRQMLPRGVEPSQDSGTCPWCGSPPGLARLVRGEGNRLLCCSLCGESWPHSLIKCPACRDEEGQDRLWLGPEDPCFVQACGKCRAYLKTVDERKLPEGEAVIPLVWATATVHLDLMAERERFRRAFPYTALT